METKITAESVVGNLCDVEYRRFLERMQERFLGLTAQGANPLFTTDAKDLFQVYLASFEDPVERQFRNCSACRQFIEQYGGLVVINDDGFTVPAFWSDTRTDDDPEVKAITAMARVVRRAAVNGVFLTSKPELGKSETGFWCHLSAMLPERALYSGKILTSSQAAAEKREDFANVSRALAEFTPQILSEAVALLKSDALYRSEKVLGPAEWLQNLQESLGKAPRQVRQNLIWNAIATAPSGFCHPRSSMIGTLLEDLRVGMDFATAANRFKAKMHPLSYQRPQAAPTAGAIAQAEKLMEQLGAAGALRRRFARFEEVPKIWQPKPIESIAQGSGVFSHLTPKGKEASRGPLNVPMQVMTWEKFRRTVLPEANRIEVWTPAIGPYTSIVTAADPNAPPILQWDCAEQRNPCSWYYYHGGAPAHRYGLTGGVFAQLSGITLKPSMWYGDSAHHGEGVILLIRGARETVNPGAALFPEILQSEFHAIRSVIEAYSRSANMEGMEEASAAGLGFGKGGTWDVVVRVHSERLVSDYKLDRWD